MWSHRNSLILIGGVNGNNHSEKKLNQNSLWHKDFTPEQIPIRYKCLCAPKDTCKNAMVTLFVRVKNCKHKFPLKVKWIRFVIFIQRNTAHQ